MTVALRQHTNGNAQANSLTLTFTATQANSFLAVFITAYDSVASNGGLPNTPTNWVAGPAYTTTNYLAQGANNDGYSKWYFYPTNPGSLTTATFTCTGTSGDCYISGVFGEFTGLTTQTADVSGTGSGSIAAESAATGTTTVANDLVLFGVANDSGSSSETWGSLTSGFALIDSWNNGSIGIVNGAWWKVVSSTGTQTATVTPGSGALNWNAVLGTVEISASNTNYTQALTATMAPAGSQARLTKRTLPNGAMAPAGVLTSGGAATHFVVMTAAMAPSAGGISVGGKPADSGQWGDTSWGADDWSGNAVVTSTTTTALVRQIRKAIVAVLRPVSRIGAAVGDWGTNGWGSGQWGGSPGIITSGIHGPTHKLVTATLAPAGTLTTHHIGSNQAYFVTLAGSLRMQASASISSNQTAAIDGEWGATPWASYNWGGNAAPNVINVQHSVSLNAVSAPAGSSAFYIAKIHTTATLAILGGLINQTQPMIAAILNMAGLVERGQNALTQALTAALGMTAVPLQNAVQTGLAGAFAPAGLFVKGLFSALTAAFAPSGAATSNAIKHGLTAALVGAGLLSKARAFVLAASLGSTGVIGKAVSHLLTGTLQPTIAFSTGHAQLLLQSLTAALGLTGSTALSTHQHATAALGATGTTLRSVARNMTAALAPTGLLTNNHQHAFFQALTATLGASGTFIRQTLQNSAATLSPTPTLAKALHLAIANMTAALGATGTFAKQWQPSFTAQLGTATALMRSAATSFTAALVMATAFLANNRHVLYLTLGAILGTGATVKVQTGHLATAVFAAAGSLAIQTQRTLTAATAGLAASGLGRQIQVVRSAVLGLVPHTATRIDTGLSAVLNLSAVSNITFVRSFVAAVAPAGALSRAGIRSVVMTAVLAPAAVISKQVQRILPAAVVGSVTTLTKGIRKGLAALLRVTAVFTPLLHARPGIHVAAQTRPLYFVAQFRPTVFTSKAIGA